jgi:cytosine/adenosine deaminase-related metal-dependent hydrolase
MIPGIARLFPIWFRDSDEVLLRAEAGTLAEIEANLDFGRRYMGRGDGRLQPMMSPHACDTHTPATLAAIREAAGELGTGVHIHLSQGARETATVRRMQGMTPTQWLEKVGILAEGPVFGAHMSGLDWEVDPPILRRHGVVYAHCPSAGGAGGDTQPFPEALAARIPVNVAIDTHSNDFLENLKLAVLYGQARHALREEFGAAAMPSRRPTIADAVDAATRVPAHALRRDDLGVLREGARADLVSVDVSGLLVGGGALPPEPLNHLLYANGKMVRNVFVDGRTLVRDGQFVAANEQKLLADGGAVVEKLWSTLRREGWLG